MSLGGVPIRIANMQFSNLYPRHRSTIISIYSGAFSASSIVYVLLQFIYSSAGISFFYVNLILVLLSLLMIPFTLFILPPDRIQDYSEPGPPSQNAKLAPQALPANIIFDKKSSVFTVSQITLKDYKAVSSPVVSRKVNASNNNNEDEAGYLNHAYVYDEHEYKAYDQYSDDDRPVVSTTPPPPNGNVLPPLRMSLSSLAYNLHQLWFSWMITYMLLYVGSMNSWTQRVTPSKSNQMAFLNLYGIIQVLALVISPLAGVLMDWQLSRANLEPDPMEKRIKQIQSGFWPLFITNLTLLVCVVCHYFDNEWFIYTSIVFVTIYRAFLLAVGSAFLRIRFHPTHFNRLLGIMSSVSAVISLLQIPLFSWETSSEAGVLHVSSIIKMKVDNLACSFVLLADQLVQHGRGLSGHVQSTLLTHHTPATQIPQE